MYDVISSSDDEAKCSDFQSPLKKKIAFKLATKNILYNKESIVQRSNFLLRLACMNRIKHDSLLEIYNLFSYLECSMYSRINEMLCINFRSKDMYQAREFQVLGFYKKDQFGNDILLDKSCLLQINLNFPVQEILPTVSSYIIIFCYLNISERLEPLLTVYNWRYCYEALVENYHNVMNSQRVYIQNINKKIDGVKKPIECDMEIKFLKLNIIEQLEPDELLELQFRELLNISSDIFE